MHLYALFAPGSVGEVLPSRMVKPLMSESSSSQSLVPSSPTGFALARARARCACENLVCTSLTVRRRHQRKAFEGKAANAPSASRSATR